jgi:hypothetical protein
MPAERSSFALWLDAINCTDPESLAVAEDVRFSGDEDRVAARWRTWPGHRAHVLWWVR